MLALFTAAIFLSALLLFLVQPMVGKMVLPVLGGTPAVWNTCMVFFQVLLLIGYLYSHLLTKYLKPAAQAVVHSVVVLAAIAALPVALPRGLDIPTGSFPVPWLLGVLGSMAAAPFLVLSTTGPLVQRWFSATDHRLAKDPYFLYAASNAGSLLALLAYPAAIEPFLRVRLQSVSWSSGYVLLAALLVGCAVMRVRRARPAPATEAATAPVAPIGWRARAEWLLLALAPSSLMLGATTYISTDLAPVPLLWIVPLSIYLVTMIIAFGRLGPAATRIATLALPPCVVALTVLMLIGGDRVSWLHVPLHLIVLFVGAMACHGRLAMKRPGPAHLTEYFLIVSLGGALGGTFNGIVAPLVFDRILEYQIAIALTCGIAIVAARGQRLLPAALDRIVPHPSAGMVSVALGAVLVGAGVVTTLVGGMPANGLGWLIKFVVPVGCGAMLILAGWDSDTRGWRTWLAGVAIPVAIASLYLSLEMVNQMLKISGTRLGTYTLHALIGLACLALAPWGWRFAGGIIALMALGAFSLAGARSTLLIERSFFGVHRVQMTPEGGAVELMHGTTHHGCQLVAEDKHLMPTSYYHPTGPAGGVFKLLNALGRVRSVGLVGLGTGALASYSSPGQRYTFYEIDPAMVRVASNPNYFTFIKEAKGAVDFRVGDGRLLLERAEGVRHDLIVIDAFSSDSIPMHLLTVEAMKIYVDHLADRGVLLMHTSNRHLRLDGVVIGNAQSLGLAVRRNFDEPTEEQAKEAKAASIWLAVARSPDDLSFLDSAKGWKRPEEITDGLKIMVWTDDFSNILSVFQQF